MGNGLEKSMNDKEHYKCIEEGVTRARLIREDLKIHPTEYFPDKVRDLNKAYIATAKEIVRQGNFFLDKSEDFELGLKVATIIEGYKNLLRQIDK
jgi:hypothetical protein